MKTNKLKIGLTIAIVSILVMIIILAFTILPEAYKAPIILKGVVITPDEVYDPGWIVVNNRKIESVSPNQINIPGAIEIDTGGIIFPGLINLHDHVVWNVFPRWDPNQVFMNRYEWRMGNEDYVKISAAFSGISADLFCEMNTYGEIRALAGGTTSIVGTANRLCIRGLVRNLDFLSGFYQIPIIQDHAHIRNLIDVPNDIQEIIKFLNADESEALFIHLAEGVGPAMRAEFDQMDEKGLLTDKTAIIHGIALSPDQYRRMNEKGASLIWSPRGNLELYGQTADITSALEADVMVAIGSDWAITGSANILDELRFAAEWNSTNLGNLLNDKQLVEMVTTIPAAIAGISEEVGTISEGKFADLLVISGDPSNPYRSLIDADPESVQLVLVDGIPVFGEILLMERFWDSAELSQVDIGGAIKALRQTEFTDMVYDLKQALSDYDFDLASIAEVVNVEAFRISCCY